MSWGQFISKRCLSRLVDDAVCNHHDGDDNDDKYVDDGDVGDAEDDKDEDQVDDDESDDDRYS
eukprot:963670-Karenia_brevis.AAC.1